MMRTYTLPSSWDAVKFAVRYNLNPNFDFWVDAHGDLIVRPTLPDDPPIFEAPAPIIPSPIGIWVHEMKALGRRQGERLLDGQGTSCYHIVVENELLLSDPWFTGMHVDTGSTAYLIDKSKTLVWDGTKWK